MDSRVILVGALGILVAGYVFYGKFVSRIMGVDPRRPTPAHTKQDGVDYVPARHWLMLFGHHFSSICAAGPIVGPAVAVVYWGWAPSLIWILVGGILLGAVADFTSLMVAIRHDGVSISEVAAQVVTPRARLFFSIFIFLALLLVLAVFAILTAKTFVQQPTIVVPSFGILPVAALAGLFLYRGRDSLGKFVSVTVIGLALLVLLMLLGEYLPITWGFGNALDLWIWVLLAYCFLASVLPVQYLLQPRDYLSSYVLFATIGCGMLGILITGPVMSAAGYHAFNPADWPKAGPLFPMLFVTIACGAISGFHSVVSSGTTCKQIATEAHACRIGYGAMLMESLVAVLVLIAIGAGLSPANAGGLIRGKGGAIAAFGAGYGAITKTIFGTHGTALAVMALNFFILTTLDTATRLARYILQELLPIRDRYTPTAIVVALTAVLALSGSWRTIWPVFGASNQLVGALALLVTSLWLLQKGRKCIYTLVPSILMLIVTIGALGLQLKGSLWSIFGARTLHWSVSYVIGAIDFVLIVLALFVVIEALQVFLKMRKQKPSAAGG